MLLSSHTGSLTILTINQTDAPPAAAFWTPCMAYVGSSEQVGDAVQKWTGIVQTSWNKKDGYHQQNVRQRQKLISIIDYDVCMTFY